MNGKTVTLKLSVVDARLEDLLRLAVQAKKIPMTGAISFDTDFELPPGDIDVIDKLNLHGAFSINSARFTTIQIQQELNEMSARARGKPERLENIASNFRGHFLLKDGIVNFPRLTFEIPGANVFLEGNYDLRSERVDLRGDMRMKAKLSKTTKGLKSFFLKMVDPFFRKGERTVIPIKITGTLEDLSFGLNLVGNRREQ